jgi:ABC-2 type transport system permease protein
MTGVLLSLDLRRSRALLFWMAVVVLVYGGLMAAFYPVIRENSKLFEDYLSIFPEPLMAAFGMEGSLADPGVFFNTYVGSMVWPIVATMVGAILGTRAVAADYDRGFLELPLATRVDRVHYLASSIVGQLTACGLLAVATVVGVLAVGLVAGASFDAGRFLLAVPILFVFACAVSAVATLLSVVTLSRGISAGLVAGLVILMYLLEVISKLDANFQWLGLLSAFHYLRTIATIDAGTVPLENVAVFVVTATLAWAAALIAFRRRDLVA